MSKPLTKAVFRLENGYENDLKKAYGEIFANLASMNMNENCEQSNGVRRTNKRLAKRRGFANRQPELFTEETLTKVSGQDCLRNGHEEPLKLDYSDTGIHSHNNKVSDTPNGIEFRQKQSHQKLRRLSENKTSAVPKTQISLRDLRPHSQLDSKDLLEDTELRKTLDVSTSTSSSTTSSSSGSNSYFESQVETAFTIIHENTDQIRPRQNLRPLRNTEDIYDYRLKQKIIDSLRTCDTSAETRPLHYKTIRTKHDILYVTKADV